MPAEARKRTAGLHLDQYFQLGEMGFSLTQGVRTELSSGTSAPAGGLPDSLVEVLQVRAAAEPDRPAYLFLTDGESQETNLSYSQLDGKARQIAARLAGLAGCGDRALLLYPAGPEMIPAFMGCLYAGVVPIPLFPPRPNRTLWRLEKIVEDSGARVALTQSSRLGDLAPHSAANPWLAGMTCVPTDDIDAAAGPQWDGPAPAGDQLAFLQYTSGSTSVPRGVMVTHANLVYNCDYMAKTWGLTQDTFAVTWLPHFHDMGLIEGLLNPLFTGYPTVVMSPAHFAQRPLLWLQAISRYRASHSGAPNFAFELCLEKIKPQQREMLDLSSWTSAYSGAEPVRKETLDRFAATFKSCGFRAEALNPSYGLAEATLMVSGGPKLSGPMLIEVSEQEFEQGRIVPGAPAGNSTRPSGSSGQKANGNGVPAQQPKTRWLVGCGRWRPDTDIAIVDPHTQQRCPPDLIGEIWVSGPTRAAGYWRREQDSRDTFEAFIADGGGGPFLRTGDLGFVFDGELFVTGRVKDLIIIRGANYYPQDIEWVAAGAHPALRRGYGAAFSVDAGAQERLVVLQEISRQYRKAQPAELEAIAASIRQAVAGELDLETFSVQLLSAGTIPMTSSGKIQRHACRERFLARSLQVVYDSTPALGRAPQEAAKPTTLSRDQLLEMRAPERLRALISYLRSEVADVLEISAPAVSPQTPLGALGIDSLKGNQLTQRLQQNLNVALSNTMVWNHPTVSQIALHIAEQMGVTLGPRQHNGEANGLGGMNSGRLQEGRSAG